LEAELDELRQQRKELEAQLALRQDAESKREKACRLAQQRVEELEREHKSLFDQVKDIKESRKIHDGAMGDLAAVQRKPKQ
jgi:chromosome segregation ATPase